MIANFCIPHTLHTRKIRDYYYIYYQFIMGMFLWAIKIWIQAWIVLLYVRIVLFLNLFASDLFAEIDLIKIYLQFIYRFNVNVINASSCCCATFTCKKQTNIFSFESLETQSMQWQWKKFNRITSKERWGQFTNTLVNPTNTFLILSTIFMLL